jgi:sensor histidine kinase regulating citrate/malate metabolism
MDNVKRARDYIYDMKINSEKVHFEIKTGNEIADAVINQKYMIAKKHEIEFNVIGALGENMGINAVDLCALMSNGLDNAIEANLRIKNKKFRKINVHIKPYKDYLLIEIINTVEEEIKNIENLQTTKKDKHKHGFGMLSMKKVVEKYEGYLQYNYENNCFNLSIMLKVINQ